MTRFTRLFKPALLALGFLVVVAQAIRPVRVNPPVSQDVGAPAEVAALLRRACYDCHSHETVWPWYAQVAPVSWLVAHDVEHGRRELDLSAWDILASARKIRKLRKSAVEIAEGEMPPWYYRAMHPEARLSPRERDRLRAWTADEIRRLGG